MTQADPGFGGVQNGAGPGTGGGEFPSDEEYKEPANLYTINDAYYIFCGSGGTPPATATPGTTVYFCVLAAGQPRSDNVYTPVLRDEADLVAIQISGITKDGEVFQMAADRATVMPECGVARGCSPPSYPAPYAVMPYYGPSAFAYRVVPWKVPPFMPEGKYTVRMFAYQTNGSTPRYFTDTEKVVAQGAIVVGPANWTPSGVSLRFDPRTRPSASNPVFDLDWGMYDFDSNPSTLRVTLKNVDTKRYYCISPGSIEPSLYRITCASIPTEWDANMPVYNNGSTSVRYNSTALFGGQRPARIPAGGYYVLLDVVDRGATTTANEQYMTTENTAIPSINLP